MKSANAPQRGFSLIELSIVLLIVALLSGGLMLSLASQRAIAENTATEHQLELAHEALLGFAASHGRLPCPAAPNSTGTESPVGGGECTHPWNGFLPAITLGLHPVDENGYAIDPWGNPIRYAITTFKNPLCGATPCISSENGLRNAWNGSAALSPDLRICSKANGSSTDCAAKTSLSNDAVAVIFSRGKSGGLSPQSTDEAANEDNDRLFVSHAPNAAPNQFEHHLNWVSASILYSRLIAAGRLP